MSARMVERLSLREMVAAPRALIGMLHLGALPGSPAASQGVDELIERSVAEARVYRDAGFNALMIENMHDRPYLAGAVGPEVVAAMTAIGRAVRDAVALPLGVQVLAGANREALAVALACGASFIRAEAFVFAHVADEGLLQAGAGELLRYRRAIGAEPIAVFADVKKKHAAHAITADVDLVETARAAAFFLADGVIVTGAATGRAADPAEVAAVAQAVTIPTLVGSGISPENLGSFAAAAGFIVGSSVKRDGFWSNALDPGRVKAMARAFAALPAPR
jgi:membrane complex biogenesis BtpA family protein